MSRDEAASWLARWSRRKAAVREAARATAEAEAPLASAAPPAESEALTPAAAPKEDPAAPAGAAEGAGAPAPAEALPPIETLTYESDFSPFLEPGVPAALRQAALRKLWRSNPLLANLDGLNDYDEDYSQIGKLPEAVASLFRVGRGMVSAEEAAAEDNAASTPADVPAAAPAESPPARDAESATESEPDRLTAAPAQDDAAGAKEGRGPSLPPYAEKSTGSG